MTEDFLHYIWRYGLFFPLSTNTLENVEVIDTGQSNRDSGPDFFNAMIKFGDTIMAGNVEIHINASDWYKHGHHCNKAYDSVILQLVLNADTEVRQISGAIIPTAEIRFDKILFDNYRELLENEHWIPCESLIPGADKTVIGEWLALQSIRRLEEKALVVGNALCNNKNDWQESFYQQLARNFGFRLNGWAFEMLARTLPFRLLLRHRDNLFQLEAMLFGQAGMLECGGEDAYFRALQREWCFLKRKYSLKSHEKHLWKFLRLRPANFPTIRIAQFASFIHQTTGLFACIMEIRDLKVMSAIFNISASAYWDNHYVFGKTSRLQVKAMGKFAILSIIINTIVPFLYFYGKHRQIPELTTRAVNFLKELPPESNSIIDKWKALGVNAGNAFISQALLQQKNEFCSHKRCLNCGIGNFFIKSTCKKSHSQVE